jgi:NAD-dependent SIR2 family protein deacetylase
MDRGGSVGRVYPIFSSVSNMSIIGGSIIKVTPAASQAIVPLQLDGKTWLVQVNLEEKRTERIIEPEVGSSYYYEIFYRPQNL